MLQRPLHHRRGKGVVGDCDESAPFADFGDAREIGDAEQRIGVSIQISRVSGVIAASTEAASLAST